MEWAQTILGLKAQTFFLDGFLKPKSIIYLFIYFYIYKAYTKRNRITSPWSLALRKAQMSLLHMYQVWNPRDQKPYILNNKKCTMRNNSPIQESP